MHRLVGCHKQKNETGVGAAYAVERYLSSCFVNEGLSLHSSVRVKKRWCGGK